MIHNFGLSDPSEFILARGYVRRKNPPGVGLFFLPGTTTLSALLGGNTQSNRQICVRPMWELFRRGMAFVGNVLGLPALYVPTFKDGVSFSSMVYRGSSAATHHVTLL